MRTVGFRNSMPVSACPWLAQQIIRLNVVTARRRRRHHTRRALLTTEAIKKAAVCMPDVATVTTALDYT